MTNRALYFLQYLLLVGAILALGLPAWAQQPSGTMQPIELVVRPGGQRALTPLAVPETRVESGAAGIPEVGALIRRTLGLAGYFEVLGPDRFYFDPAREWAQGEIQYNNWTNVGAAGLVRSRVKEVDGQIELDLRLFDVVAQEEIKLAWSPKTVSKGNVQAETYAFVNAVIAYYSGSPGPFGGRVAFAARGRGGFKQIFTIGTDGTGLASVTNDATIHLLPTWGQGGQVMYTSYRDDNPDLWIGPSASARKLASYSGINSGAALSPDGRELAITLSRDGNTEVYILDTEGEILRRCTNSSAEDLSPAWSPDSSQIAFVSDRAGGPQIFVMNRDCSDQRRVTMRGNYNVSPDWSPDGTRIAFTGRAGGRFDIFTVNPRNNQIDRVTQDQGSNFDPSWSPDGRYLIFASTRGGGGARLYLSTADGQIQNLLTDEISGVESPRWFRR